MLLRGGKINTKGLRAALCALLCIFIAPTAFAQSRAALSTDTSDIDLVPLIRPYKYDPDDSSTVGRFVRNNLSGSLVWAGGRWKNIRESTKSLLNAKRETGLKKYFPNPNELNGLVDRVVGAAESTYLKGGLNDSTAQKINEELGAQILEAIANRIMQVEGITNPIRREKWVSRIKQEFISCSKKSKNYYFEADGCLTATQDGFIQNIGLAVVYEATKDKLSPLLPDNFQKQNFIQQRTLAYSVCLDKKIPGDVELSAFVVQCSVASILDGIQLVTRDKLEQQIKANLGMEDVGTVRAVVWPNFTGCLSQIGKKKVELSFEQQINLCIDDLVVDTGAEMVQRRVFNTPAFVSTYRVESQRIEASKRFAQDFRSCLLGQKKLNKRVDGLLDTRPCEELVKNRVTYEIVTKQFRESAASNIGDRHPKFEPTIAAGKKSLDSCWSDNLNAVNREKCLRSSIISFSGMIANVKLEKEIPADVFAKDKTLKAGLVQSFTACLQRDLPENISTAQNLDAKLDGCTAPLLRRSALLVAENQLRSSMDGKMAREELDRVVQKTVKQDFAACLGASPDAAKLERCVVLLKEQATNLAGISIFPKELAEYFKKQGGIEAYGLQLSDLQTISKEITELHTACVAKEFKGIADKAADGKIDKCFKESIRAFVARVAKLEFKKAVLPMYPKDSSRLAELDKEFKAILFSCVDEKKNPRFGIDAYLKNVYLCADITSHTMTKKIAPEQLELALAQNLKDSPQKSMASEREAIRISVGNKAIACLDALKPADSAGRDLCVANLQKEATISIVRESGRRQIAEQLSTDKLPDSLAAVEKKMETCIAQQKPGKALSAELDQCVKSYVVDLAERIGDAKLALAIGGALGAKELALNKKQFDTIKDEYKFCLESLKAQKLNDEFFTQVAACAETLQAKATDIVMLRVRDWMQTGNPQAQELSALFAAALPCLDKLLPSTPYSDAAVSRLDPEGSLKAIAGLISNYIAYDLEKAKKDLPDLLAQLLEDLNSVTPLEARKRLVEFLRKSGAFDQLLKAMVRQNVADAFTALDPKDRPSQVLQERLMKKETFDRIFSEPEGQKIIARVADKILAPVLIDIEPLDSPKMIQEQEAVKRDIADMLTSSPHFGDLLLQGGLQQQLNELGAFTRFFARLLYGRKATNWSLARNSKEGRAAEEYIREKILRPKFKGETISPEQEIQILREAEALVRAAITNSGQAIEADQAEDKRPSPR